MSVCVVCITPGSGSYHCFIMEECLGSFIAEPGCSGDSGAGGPCSKGPDDAEKVTELKRGLGNSACLYMCVCMCLGETREATCVCVKVKRAAHERVSQKNRLPSMPQGFPYSLHR